MASTTKAKRTSKSSRNSKPKDNGMNAHDKFLYKGALPYTIHGNYLVAPAPPREYGKLSWFLWSPAQVEVAVAALNNELRLAIPVHSDLVAQAASAICSSLNINVCMGYDKKYKSLIIWKMPSFADDLRAQD